MKSFEIRQQALLEALNTRILVLDGAMGTMLQQKNPTIEDWGGPAFEKLFGETCCSHALSGSRTFTALYAAGAVMVETNSFGRTPSRWPSSDSKRSGMT